MFEHWSERRRRWFLITFCSVAWVLFLNGLAHLGQSTRLGGVGHDAVHLAGVLGSGALVWVIIGAFNLALRHWVMAVLFGISLNALLVDFGFREHFTAGVWAIECDRLDGAACAQLADYYADGRSVMHGWTDAELMARKACALGHVPSCSTVSTAPRQSCATGGRADCVAEAEWFADRGQYEKAAETSTKACQLTTPNESLEPCIDAMNSGFHDLRLVACETVQENCRVSSQHACAVAVSRCDRALSPRAGVR